MEKDLARHVVRAGFASMGKLTNLLELLKEHCSPEEYQTYLKAVATVSAHISEQIVSRATANFPDLEAEIEAKIKKYGLII